MSCLKWHGNGVLGRTTVLAACISMLLATSLRAATLQRRTELDIPYVSAGAHKQQLDLYLPPGSGFPTVLFVHGGSMAHGDRKDAPWAKMCATFAASGVACAVTSYRLFPSVTWPKPAEDIAAAFAWLRGNIGTRGGDANEIAIVGHSSGCLLASLVGSDPRYLMPHHLSTKDVFGVVAMGCRLNDRPPDVSRLSARRIERSFRQDSFGSRLENLAALRSYLPMAHMGPYLPPFLILIADAERFKPPMLADAATFVGAARACQVDADLVVLANRTHQTAVERMIDSSDQAFQRVRRFISRLSREGPRVQRLDQGWGGGGGGCVSALPSTEQEPSKQFRG